MALVFLRWWYGFGWMQLARGVQNAFTKIGRAFSAPSLLRTLFAPWRRIVTYPGASLGDHLRAILDNFVSRCIGFTVRIMVLLAAAISVLITAVFGIAALILWPLVPLLPIVGIIGGILS